MSDLSFQQLCHLTRRGGFAASNSQLERLSSATTKQQAVEQLINQPASLIDLPEWHGLKPPQKTQDPELKQQIQRQRRQMGRELKYWWFRQMVNNSAPLQEKLTLFWANHFTSSLEKVKWPAALLQQNLTLRTHALGNFRDMLKAILRDPAMLVYLDNANSKKQAPNENLSRELLELFTLGEGQYTEQDIKELARALTGASVNRKTGQYMFRKGFHDASSKLIFAERANFTPDDVADLILRQPQVAGFITDKLWRFFIDEQPDPVAIDKLSEIFVQHDFAFKPLLTELFLQDAFWAASGKQVKSPMELMVGAVQLFSLPMLKPQIVLKASKGMGQDLFSPPHVKGWAGGYAWYSSTNLALRERAAKYLIQQADFIPQFWQLLATDAVGPLPDSSDPQYLSLVLNDPAFQVV
ncbi:DUF1800 domain-containing protein [Paraglaciecola aestuariivivens]